MNVTPWKARGNWIEPFQPLEEMEREMNRVLGISFPRPTQFVGHDLWSPAVDIVDGKDEITVKAEIPGMTKDQIEVLVQNDVLTIKGEKKEEKEVKEKDCVRKERYYGSFNRSFTLPSGVDAKAVKAIYRDGILEVVLPKKEDGKSKQTKIDIK